MHAIKSQKAKRVGDTLMHSDSLVPTFLRSIASSQAASWVDMLLGFALFAWVNLAPWLATAAGAVAGGVVNCIINYRFTFHASECDWRAVIVKYTMVWTGSVALNSLGTEALYYALSNWHWLENIGFRPDGYYAAARLSVSLIVSWCWNFVLQRYFVYRPKGFDAYAIRAIESLKPRKNRKID